MAGAIALGAACDYLDGLGRDKIFAHDAALVKIAGEAGLGVFAAPDVVEKEVRQRYKVQLIARAEEVRERFYAISV